MSKNLGQRSNEDWIVALRETRDSGATQDLHEYLRRSLLRALGGRAEIDEHDIADFVQEGVLQILKRLDTFRGDSRFTTWATAIVLRSTFTELRKRRVRARGRTSFDDAAELATTLPSAEQLESQNQLHRALHRTISKTLTERQRIAILAELKGLPTIEISAQMGITQNALYKLVHDARKKLRVALADLGFTPDLTREGAMDP